VTCDLRVTWPSWIPWIRTSGFEPFRLGKYLFSFLTSNKTMRLNNHHQKKLKIKARLLDSLVVLGGKELGINKQSPKQCTSPIRHLLFAIRRICHLIFAIYHSVGRRSTVIVGLNQISIINLLSRNGLLL
jgi:hypothetical protein